MNQMGFRLFAGLGNVREALNFHARDPPPPLPPPASFFAPTPDRGGGMDWVHELAVVRLSAYVGKDAGAWRTRFDVAGVAPRAWSEDAAGWGRLALSLHWNVGFRVLHPISRSHLRPVEGSPDDVAFTISHEIVHAATAGECLDYVYHALIVELALDTWIYLSQDQVAHTLTLTHSLSYTQASFSTTRTTPLSLSSPPMPTGRSEGSTYSGGCWLVGRVHPSVVCPQEYLIRIASATAVSLHASVRMGKGGVGRRLTSTTAGKVEGKRSQCRWTP